MDIYISKVLSTHPHFTPSNQKNKKQKTKKQIPKRKKIKRPITPLIIPVKPKAKSSHLSRTPLIYPESLTKFRPNTIKCWAGLLHLDSSLLNILLLQHTDGNHVLNLLLAVNKLLLRKGLNSETVTVTEEQNTLSFTLGTVAGLNPLAPSSGCPESLDETDSTTPGVRTVVTSHNLLDSLGSLIGVVERNQGDKVVKDVSLDNSVHKVTSDESKLSVDGSGGSTAVVPGLRVVVRKRGVGVLQEGNGDEPVVNPKVGNTIPKENVEGSKLLGSGIQRVSHQGNSDVGQNNQLGILGLVQRRGRVEVRNSSKVSVLLSNSTSLLLAVVVVVSGNVGEEVKNPSNELLGDRVGEGSDGSLLGELGNIVRDSSSVTTEVLSAGLGNEDHVLLQVSGGVVVLSVGNLPGEVGNQQRAVKDPSNGVVENLGLREGLVTTLVSENPDSSSEKSLGESIDSPGGTANESRLASDGGDDVVLHSPEGSGEKSKVAGDVGKRADSRALEAVLGNGITNVLDGEVGDLELVSVGVEKGLSLGLVSHGGERG